MIQLFLVSCPNYPEYVNILFRDVTEKQQSAYLPNYLKHSPVVERMKRQLFNSLAPRRCGSNSKDVISKHMLWIKFIIYTLLACDHLSMLGFKLSHVSERGPGEMACWAFR